MTLRSSPAICVAVIVMAFTMPGSARANKEMQKAVEVLKNATDTRELEKEALWLASADDPKAKEFLAKHLQDPDFLKRLQSDQDEYVRYLRVFHILRSIAHNDASAEDLFLQLAQDKHFIKDFPRERALIDAAGFIRQPSAKMLGYLESLFGRYPSLVLEALARIGTEEAAVIAEKGFQAATDNYRLSYCNPLIQGRNSPAIFKLYQRLIAADYKNPQVKDRLVQTLFEYRDARWYKDEVATDVAHDDPPPRQGASTEVLHNLLKYSDQVLKMKLSDETKQGVMKARQEIEEILKSREAKK